MAAGRTCRLELTGADLAELDWLRVVGHATLAPPVAGDRPSARFGLGYDFADHQAYQPGDPLGHVDWRRYLITGRRECYVRKFYQELSSRLAVILDASASMNTYEEDGKFDTAKKIALALVHLAGGSYEAADVVVMGPALRGPAGTRDFPAWEHLRSPDDLLTLADGLSRLEAGGPNLLDALVRSEELLCGQYGAIVLVSDLVVEPDRLIAAVDRLAQQTGRLHAVHLVGRKDRQPLERDEDVIWTDVETGEEFAAHFDRAAHAARLDEFLREAREACERLEASYARIDCPPRAWRDVVEELLEASVVEFIR